MGYKSGPVEKNWNGVNRPALEFEAASKKQQLLNNLELHLKCQKLGVKSFFFCCLLGCAPIKIIHD